VATLNVLLYLPKENGGLALPALSTLYKQQQASRHIIFHTSQDDCVHFLEVNTRKHPRRKFCPASAVSDVHSNNTACNGTALKTKVSQQILEEDSAIHRAQLSSLRVQGQFFRTDSDLSYWAQAVPSLSDREQSFAYNAAIDTLPSNA
jgi:hypothetical protein